MRGVTRRFKAFVERFAPPDEGEPVTRERLYGIRSALAHGRAVFDADEAPWSRLRLTPNWLEQREASDTLAALVKRVVVAWLMAHDG